MVESKLREPFTKHTEDMAECVDTHDGYFRMVCSCCRKIMQDAVQLECGCRLCKKCADDERLDSATFTRCRYCGGELDLTNGSKYVS